MQFYNPNIDPEKYVIATYWMKSRNADLRKTAWDLAIGQSVGNPNVRNQWETEELFEQSSCVIMHDRDSLKHLTEGYVKIGFPVINTDWSGDGISHLLCQLMGGQVDIDTFDACRLTKIDFPQHIRDKFLGPKFGITGMREYTGQYDKPFSGAIVKPKTGMSAETLLEMVKELVDGGCDFIKEDEIMANPTFCPIEKRVDLRIAGVLSNFNPISDINLMEEDEEIYVKNIGETILNPEGDKTYKQVFANSWVYNTSSRYDVESIQSSTFTLYSDIDKSSVKVGDSVDILVGAKVVHSGAVVDSIYSLFCFVCPGLIYFN